MDPTRHPSHLLMSKSQSPSHSESSSTSGTVGYQRPGPHGVLTTPFAADGGTYHQFVQPDGGQYVRASHGADSSLVLGQRPDGAHTAPLAHGSDLYRSTYQTAQTHGHDRRVTYEGGSQPSSHQSARNHGRRKAPKVPDTAVSEAQPTRHRLNAPGALSDGSYSPDGQVAEREGLHSKLAVPGIACPRIHEIRSRHDENSSALLSRPHGRGRRRANRRGLPVTPPVDSPPGCECDRLGYWSSTWSVKEILDFASDARMRQNRRWYRALQELGRMINNPHPAARIDSMAQLQTIFSCLDTGLFQGLLKGRCHLILRPLRSHGLYGETDRACYCQSHRQVHTVNISMSTDREDSPTLFQDTIVTVLHEMCHAFMWIFLDPRQLSCFDYIIQVGMNGHGDLFQELFRRCARFLSVQYHCCVNIDEHIAEPGATDLRKRRRVLKRYADTLRALPAFGKYYRDVCHALRLDKRQDKDYLLQLIQEGWNILEIVIIMRSEDYFRFEWCNPVARLADPRSIDLGYANDYNLVVLLVASMG